MNKYETIIYWNEIDKLFVVEIPELLGCIIHGATKEEALSNSIEAVELWIETAKEDGIDIPEPRGRKLMYA